MSDNCNPGDDPNRSDNTDGGRGILASGNLGQDNAGNPNQESSLLGGGGLPDPASSGYVIPPQFIPVANTDDYGSSTSANTDLYTPAAATEIIETGPGNAGTVDYIKFAEKMKADADQLVLDLQAVQAQKAAAIAAINDDVGSSCSEDFDLKANTFITNCNSFVVDECDGSKPTITMNCTQFIIKSGSVTITVDGQNITIGGGTLNLPAGTTVGGAAILTSLPNHTHTAGTYLDSAGNPVTGTSGNPS